MKRVLILLLLCGFCLSSCTLVQKESYDTYPDWEDSSYVCIPESTRGFDAIQEDCFFCYDISGYLMKIYWNDTSALEEGGIYRVSLSGLKKNLKATGNSPVYISTATSVSEKIESTDFSTLPKVVAVSKVVTMDEEAFNELFNEQFVSICEHFYYYDPFVDKTRTFVLPDGTTSPELLYSYSTVETFYEGASYYGDDFSCEMNVETGEPIELHIDAEAELFPDIMSSEQEYHTWIEAWMEKLEVNGFSEYQSSCMTYLNTTESAFVYGYPYFYTDLKETERLISRDFKYVRYVDGYPTSDTVEVKFYCSGAVVCTLGTQSFGDAESLSVDVEALMAEAEAFVRNSLNPGFELLEIEADDMMLRCCDGRVGMEIEASLYIGVTGLSIPDEYSVSLLVFLD